MFRRWGSVVAASALIASSSMAFAGADAPNKSLLAPGKAAGVQKAQSWAPNNTVMLVGGALVVGGLALVLSDNGGHSHVSTTTTGTP